MTVETLAESLDRLMTVDAGGRGVIDVLYRHARSRQGGPLSLLAAQHVKEGLRPGSLGLIATGWPDRPHITSTIGETDGPPGAVVLARAVHVAADVVPVLITDPPLVDAVRTVVEAAGLRVLDLEQAKAAVASHAPIHAAAVLAWPTDKEEAEEAAEEIFGRHDVGFVAAVEKGSANPKGRIHTSRGDDTTDPLAKVDPLFAVAQDRSVPTVGVGDGGNEVGMAVIADALAADPEFPHQCRCDCGGGILPDQPVDVLVSAAVSNWGAYAIAACLAVLTGNRNVFHNRALERRMLNRAADAGLIDGRTGLTMPGADGLELDGHEAFVTLAGALVDAALENPGS